MSCTVCGNHLKENTKFCGNCGQAVTQTHSEGLAKDIDETKTEYIFQREKCIGNLSFQEIITQVYIEEAVMRYNQKKITLSYFQKALFETEHNIHDFVTVKCSRTIDLSFLILGLLSLVIGFETTEIFYLIITGVLFWLGLGTKIVITKSNGAKINIVGSSHSECESFIRDLVSINKSIVVKA